MLFVKPNLVCFVSSNVNTCSVEVYVITNVLSIKNFDTTRTVLSFYISQAVNFNLNVCQSWYTSTIHTRSHCFVFWVQGQSDKVARLSKKDIQILYYVFFYLSYVINKVIKNILKISLIVHWKTSHSHQNVVFPRSSQANTVM